MWCPDGKARGNTLTATSAVRCCFYRPPRPAVFGNKTKRNNQTAVLLVKIPHAFAPAPLPHTRRLCECVCVIVCISSGDNIIIKTHCHRRTFYHGGRTTIYVISHVYNTILCTCMSQQSMDTHTHTRARTLSYVSDFCLQLICTHYIYIHINIRSRS